MDSSSYNRRDLLKLLGYGAGASVMANALAGIGMVSASPLKDLNLAGTPKASNVVILGAGVAGLVAAYELKKSWLQCADFGNAKSCWWPCMEY